MDSALGFLTFGTLGFVLVFAYVSARVAEKRAREGGEKSTLSRDGKAEFLASQARRA
jgi:flagellar biogenesis protein FliO